MKSKSKINFLKHLTKRKNKFSLKRNKFKSRKRLQSKTNTRKIGGCNYCPLFANTQKVSDKFIKEKKNKNAAQCSIGSQLRLTGSCLPNEIWDKIQKMYFSKKNYFTKEENKNKYDSLYPTGGKQSFLEELEKTNPSCEKNELCLLTSNSVLKDSAKSIIQKYFAPIAPSSWNTNPNSWLSNIDIENVMNQYMDNYPSFSFVGTFPIDFDLKTGQSQCVANEVCNFNLSDFIKKEKKEIGFIFNTDLHTGPGKHWISLFISLPLRLIYFFDSTADSMPKEISNFIKRIVQQGKQMQPQIDFHVMENKRQHQTGNTECGVYSLFFLDHMLQNPKQTIQSLKSKVFSDKFIENFRNIYFNQF